MIFGKGGEYRPRYGLWLDTSPECQAAVRGLLSEGFDCDVVLKYGARCHVDLPFRPVMSLSRYSVLHGAGVLPHDKESGLCGCYIREVFFPQNVALRRREVVNG